MIAAADQLRAAYFDSIAEAWDGWHDAAEVQAALGAGLADFGVGPDETVLDLGCGTGNLTQALLDRLSAVGRVVAVDLAPRMIAVARRKIGDERVRWLCAAATALPLDDGCCDRAICCSVWPHFGDPAAAATELRRVLRPGGSLQVWHLSSRDRINAIHAGAGEVVRSDRLPPALEVAALLERCGFAVAATQDDERGYLVSARPVSVR